MTLSSVLRIGALAALTLNLTAHASEALTGIACRSVHLAYAAAPATAFYNEGRVTDSAPGSYFMMTGWTGGYFGIQELGDGKKVVIFSLWDAAHTDDPKALAESKRTQVVYHAPDVRIGRFGGEGTGGQSFFNYEWKKGETYRFIVHVRPGANGRSEYSGFFFVPETKTWKHLVTFSSPFAPKQLKGLHSFVEDFRRNRESTKFTRQAEYKNLLVRTLDGQWKPIGAAQFTADGNKAVNIDAGLVDNRFYLGTGGDLTNVGKKLWDRFVNPASAKVTVPDDVVATLDAFEKTGAIEPPPAK